jgi:hypothetical protein
MRLLQKRELSPTQVFDNNQLTMVRKCERARQEKQPSVTQALCNVQWTKEKEPSTTAQYKPT